MAMAMAMAKARGQATMRGDILLFRSGGILKDRVVCAYTGGPFCHCEIDLGDGTSVGAHSEDGITQRPHGLIERRVIISLDERTSPERIESGIAWVLEHVGEPFSWASIADLVVPSWLATMAFGRRYTFNCANLVARYLDIAGALDVSSGKRSPMAVSPNDIARAAGILDPARGLRHAAPARISGALLALLPRST